MESLSKNKTKKKVTGTYLSYTKSECDKKNKILAALYINRTVSITRIVSPEFPFSLAGPEAVAGLTTWVSRVLVLVRSDESDDPLWCTQTEKTPRDKLLLQ